jgi:general secretion pathway protein J
MRQAGFTLLEILVALVVLGFLLVGLAEGTRFGLRAWDAEATLVSRNVDMDAVERVLRNLVTSADTGDPSEPPSFRGTSLSLDFVGTMPASVVGAVGSAARHAEFGIGLDEKHRLVLRWRPHPHAERLSPLPPPTVTVLLDNVDGIAFGYRKSPQEGGDWSDQWDAPTLPAAVRITLTFPKGDRRHWPTIVVAPMLSRS